MSQKATTVTLSRQLCAALADGESHKSLKSPILFGRKVIARTSWIKNPKKSFVTKFSKIRKLTEANKSSLMPTNHQNQTDSTKHFWSQETSRKVQIQVSYSKESPANESSSAPVTKSIPL
jgi:hypothetical protein